MSKPIRHALVSGGAGFIGSHLVEALVAQGSKVTVLDNLSSGKITNLQSVKKQIHFLKGDVRDRALLQTATEGCDVIFHLAAIVSVQQSIDDPVESAMVNEIGSLNLLEAARTRNVKRVVFSSSCAIYGDDPQLPKTETLRPKPASPYAAQKRAVEQYMRVYFELYGLETICLRYFNVYGPRQDPSSPYSGVISIFMTKAIESVSPTIYGDGNQSRDFIFVQDVVKANLLAATSDQAGGQIFNIGTGKQARINQLWDMICALTGTRVSATFQPARPGDIYASVANTNHAKTLIGFAHDHAFEDGLALTLKWYAQQGE
jgi:UDP-glucose 4-epimerase